MSLVHRKLTRIWAEEVGFSPIAAKAIAEADVSTDGNKNFPVRAYHMRPILFGRDRRRELMEAHRQKALAAAGEGDRASAWENLGRALHILQDLEAHGNYRLHRRRLDDPNYTLEGKFDPSQSRLKTVEAITRKFLQQALSSPNFPR
jgi:hypothetical protein